MSPTTNGIVEGPGGSGKRALLIVIGILAVGAIGLWLVLANRSPSADSPNEQPSGGDITQQPLTASFERTISRDELSGVVTVSLTISNPTRVERVEYYVDDKFLGVTYSLPFSFELDTTTLTPGKHTLIAKLYDKDGQVVTEETTITVSERPVDDQPGVSSPSKPASSAGSGSNSGSGTPAPSADTEAPSVIPGVVTLTANDGYTVNISWNASADNVGVTGYKILRDGALLSTSTATSYKDQTVVPGNTYEYSIIAVDAATNESAASPESFIVLESTSIWIEGDAPFAFDADATAIEVGVKFKPLVNGKITGVRFYKGPLNTGTHVGNLWTADGSNLATAIFSGETASGWQEVSFTTPVDVTAGTTYVASYYAPNGRTSYSSSYFATTGITSQYLEAMASGGPDGSNGVFRVGAGFPTSSFSSANYWVDVAFTPNPGAGGPAVKALDISKVYGGYPGSNNTGIPVGVRLPVRDRGIIAYQPGLVIENIEIRDDSINIHANDVTIRNVRVTNTDTALLWAVRQSTGISGLTVEDSELFGNGTNQIQYGIIDAGSDLTATRLNIHTISDGIQANSNVYISDTFIHDLVEFPGDHNDSFLATGGDGIVLTHNTFHNPLVQTAALGLFCDFSAITNVTAFDNLLIGGGYSVYGGGGGAACASSRDIKFINNRFLREVHPNGGFHGPVTNYNPAQTGSVWTGNVWHDDGTPVNP